MVLAADGQRNLQSRGYCSRGPALGFRELSFDIHVHPAKDPGCLLRGHDFLRPFSEQYRHAIVMLDRQGCGREDSPRQDLEDEFGETIVFRRLGTSCCGDCS